MAGTHESLPTCDQTQGTHPSTLTTHKTPPSSGNNKSPHPLTTHEAPSTLQVAVNPLPPPLQVTGNDSPPLQPFKWQWQRTFKWQRIPPFNWQCESPPPPFLASKKGGRSFRHPARPVAPESRELKDLRRVAVPAGPLPWRHRGGGIFLKAWETCDGW